MPHFFKAVTIATLLIFTFFPQANAESLGPAIGKKSPHDLALSNQDGIRQSFEDLIGDKGLVLFFVRSADWCPYCELQLIELSRRVTEITDLGYGVASLSYDSTEELKKFSDRFEVSYAMLSDPNSEAIKAFNILDKSYEEDHFAYGVPHPVVFVISPEQVITNKLFIEGYKERPSIETITDALK